jgi:hypothetical protein
MPIYKDIDLVFGMVEECAPKGSVKLNKDIDIEIYNKEGKYVTMMALAEDILVLYCAHEEHECNATVTGDCNDMDYFHLADPDSSVQIANKIKQLYLTVTCDKCNGSGKIKAKR